MAQTVWAREGATMDARAYTVAGLDIGGSLHIAVITEGAPWIFNSKPYANAVSAPWAWQGQATSVSEAVAYARQAFAAWHHQGGEGLIGTKGEVYGVWDETGRREHSVTLASVQPTVKRRWFDPRRYW